MASQPQFDVDGDLVTIKVDGVAQSAVNTADATRLEFAYAERMADYLDVIESPGLRYRVIHVGGAGMSLARYVAATRPTSPQIVLEPDEALTELVRLHLPLPARSGIKVRPIDGRAGIAAMHDGFARVVLIDAFDGASVPAALVSKEFFADVKRVLVADGLVLMNLIDQRPFDWARRVVAGLVDLFEHVSVGAQPPVLNRPVFGNLVVGASDAPIPLAELRRASARAIWPHRILAGAELTRFLGGARPFSDADAVASPVAGSDGKLRFT